MKPTVSFSFTEIKIAIQNVKIFLREEFWEGEPMTCKTAIEYDLGITGDDASELMQKFENRYNVDMSAAKENFYKYFDDEGQFATPAILFFPFLLLFVLTILIPVAIFNYKLAKDSFHQFLNNLKNEPREKEMRIGDLAVSLLTGRFTERESVLINLK